MKRIHFLFSMLALAGGLLLTACSDDERQFFTQDEVIGDILTGKQISLKDNTLKVYTTEGGSVNVQGASGSITAVSSDERVATARCVNDQPKQVVVQGVKEGSARITVTDAKGQSAAFVVVVTDFENAWIARTVITTGDEVRCTVKGVGHDDSLAIVKDAQDCAMSSGCGHTCRPKPIACTSTTRRTRCWRSTPSYGTRWCRTAPTSFSSPCSTMTWKNRWRT